MHFFKVHWRQIVQRLYHIAIAASLHEFLSQRLSRGSMASSTLSDLVFTTRHRGMSLTVSLDGAGRTLRPGVSKETAQCVVILVNSALPSLRA